MSRAAIRYAKAIIDIATESNNTTAVNNDMKTIGTAIKESAELSDFYQIPLLNGDKNECFKRNFSIFTKRN
jgi:F-type H+-transporting ATPase subunit delta